MMPIRVLRRVWPDVCVRARCRHAALLAVAAVLAVGSTALSEDFSNWSGRLEITFSGYTRATVLTNFPVLVKLGPGITGFDYGQFASPAGYDLRFAVAGGTTPLAYEVEKWDSAGESLVWVRVPELTNNAAIRAYWGNPVATAAPSDDDTGATWSQGFLGVYHLHDDSFDSTTNLNDGVDEAGTAGLPTDCTGVVGDGLDFASGSHVDLGGTGWDMLDSAHLNTFTMGAWVNPDTIAADGAIIARYSAQMLFWLDAGGLANFVVYDSGGPRTSESLGIGAVQNQWQYVVATSDGSVLRMYVNGALSATSGGTVDLAATTTPFALGTENGNSTARAFDGSLDEARIAYPCRSEDWIWAEFMTMASNGVFGVVSDAECRPVIANLAPSGLGADAATLRGELMSTGTAATTVWVYFGSQDGEDDAAAWETNMSFGAQTAPVTLTTNVTELVPAGIYYYRFCASNADGIAWALDSERFATPTNFTTWLRRMPIAFDDYTGSAPLVDFPALVKLNESIAGFRYADFASPEGGDLRFSLADEVSRLNHEIDEWNTNGTSTVWVQIPMLTNNTTIYAFWGQPAAAAAPAYTTNGATWSRGHVGVWHMKELANAFADSALLVGDNAGTDAGTDGVVVDAMIGKGSSYTSSGLVNISNQGDYLNLPRATIMLWYYKRSRGGGGNYGTVFGANNNVWGLRHYLSDALDLRLAGTVVTGPGALANGAWHFLAYTYDGAAGTVQTYLNGALVDSGATTAGWYDPAPTQVYLIGSGAQDARAIDGIVDEMRASSVVRSADWIRATYLNTASNALFNTYSNAVYNRPVAPGVATLAATDMTTNGATLHGALLSTGTAATAVWVYYGETDETTNAAAWDTNAAFGVQSAVGALATNVTGLAPHTTYYCRFYAANAAGGVWADNSTNFMTLALTRQPTIDNLAATGITHEAAWVRGDLTSTGTAETTVWVYWGATDGGTDAGEWNESVPLGTQSATGVLTTQLAGLDPYSTYYYRFFATNDVGGAWAPATASFGTALDYTAWSRKLRIDFNYDGAAPLTNFPALLKLGSVVSGFSYDDFASATGGDLRVLSADERTELNFEIDAWDPEGDSCVWVQLPVLTSNSYVFAYWGNPGAATAPACTTNGATWDDTFHGVWHLGQGAGGAGDVSDSTSNRYDGANDGTVNVDGFIAKAQDFERDNTDFIDVPGLTGAALLPAANTPITLSGWLWAETIGHDGIDNRMMSIHDALSPSSVLALGVGRDDRAEVYHDGDYPSDNLVSVGTVETGRWYYAAATYDGTTVRLYLDGALDTSEEDTLNAGAAYPVKLGSFNGTGNCFDGILDELRIEKGARSADWIRACWLNQGSNSTFNAYGTVTSTLDAELPDIATLAPSNVTDTTAFMNGELISAGTSPAAVILYWGEADGGTNATAWDHSAAFPGTQPAGELSTNLTGLAQSTAYAYRYRATNAAGTRWANASRSFVTLGPPAVDNAAGADAGLGYAVLNGTLLRTNGAPAGAIIYWGTTDGGTNSSAWEHAAELGATVVGPFAYDTRPAVADWATLADTDVGTPALAGSASYAAGTWSVTGGGDNIWGTADNCHFAYRAMAGDFDVYCRMADFTGGTDDYRKGGIMVRASLAADSRNAMILRTPATASAQIRFQRRLTDGATTADASTGGKTNAWYWLRLTRQGDDFTAYWAEDLGGTPGAWTQVGGIPTIDMGDVAYLGLAVSARNDGELTTSSFDHWSGIGDADLLYGQPYYYRCGATNSYGPAWADATTNFLTTAPDWLALTNTAASDMTATSAVLHATLECTGAVFDVYAYWGELDGETNLTAWAHTNYVGRFANATWDPAGTATGLTASTWYSYTYRATNLLTNLWAHPSATFKTMGPPLVGNRAPTNVTATSAGLGGTLLDGGSAEATIYWGLLDGGETASAWANTTRVGTVGMGAFATNVTVGAGGTYYYRCYVTNGVGADWADVTTNFTTPYASISIADAGVQEGDSGTTDAVLAITLSSPCASNVAVHYATADDTATGGADFTAAAGTLVIPAGTTQTGVTIRVLGDTTPEWPQETFYVTLSAPSNCVLGDAQGTVTIIEDDVDVADWRYRRTIAFSGYTGSEVLTNFPALVVFDPAVRAFSYDQFASPRGYDLRFVDSTGTRMLSYEVEQWNTNGASYVWVRVPRIENSASCIDAYWGAPMAELAVRRPTDIDDCVLWLRGDLGVQTNANGVMAWLDQSGYNHHAAQASGSNEPQVVPAALNGEPVIRLDGVNDFMVIADSPTLDNTAGLTIFAVAAPSNLSGAPRGLLSKRHGSDDQQSYSLFFYTGDTLRVDIDNSNNRLNSALTFTNGVTHAIELCYDGTQPVSERTRLVLDGTDDSLGSESSTSIPDYASTMTIGTLNEGYGNYLGADIAELIVYRRALSAAERQRVGRYLEMRYGLGSAYGTDVPAYTVDGSTWAQNYGGVWHLTEGGSTTRVDATAFDNDSDLVAGTVGAAAGKIAGGNVFDGSSYLRVPDSVSLGDATVASMSVSAWLKSDVLLTVDGDTRRALEKGDNYFLLQGNDGSFGSGGMDFMVKRGGATKAVSSGVPFEAARWYHLTGTFDGMTLRAYLDGTPVGSLVIGGPIDDDGLPLRIGSDDSGKYFDGVMDEVRISTVARSADWVWAAYMTMASNSVFQSDGGVVVTHPPTVFIVK